MFYFLYYLPPPHPIKYFILQLLKFLIVNTIKKSFTTIHYFEEFFHSFVILPGIVSGFLIGRLLRHEWWLPVISCLLFIFSLFDQFDALFIVISQGATSIPFFREINTSTEKIYYRLLGQSKHCQ